MVNNIKQTKGKEQLPAAAVLLAKAIRAISVPPLLIGALLVVLYFVTPIFPTLSSLLLSILFLAVIPALAYAVWAVIPAFRKKGRDMERKLAFVFSLGGYFGAVVYGLVADVGRELLVIYFTYFLSVVLLTLCNKLLKFRASGHGCGVTGPLLLPAYYISPFLLPLSLLVLALVYLSSLLLHRHTLKELTAGSTIAALSFVLCVILL